MAYARNEAIQIMRDPIRLTFAFLGSALLMLVCGFGITSDVEHIKVAALDRDQSQDSRTYLEQFRSIPAIFQVATSNILRRGCSKTYAAGRSRSRGRDPSELQP